MVKLTRRNKRNSTLDTFGKVVSQDTQKNDPKNKRLEKQLRENLRRRKIQAEARKKGKNNG